MTAQEAYKQWKSMLKIDMQVRTEEQWFELGYNLRQSEIDSLVQLIKDMDSEIKKLKKAERSSKPSKPLQKPSVKD